MYGQQDQVWQANNSWGYQQWPYPAQNASLSQEEVWAAKARAWAASKVVQDEPRPVQPGPTAPQVYQDYPHQHRDPHPLEGQQHSLQPPGQEAAGISYYQSASNQGQSVPIRPSEHPTERLSFDRPMQDIPPLVTPEPGFDISEQKAVLGGGQPQSNDMQAVFSSSYAHDTTASYRLDNAISGPPGTDRLDPMPQPPPKQLSAAPMYTQQATLLLPQSQASPLVSQPRFAYTEKPSPSGYEQHQQQQVPSNYHQPPPPPPPPLQQQPPQPQYQSSVTMEGIEGEFGLSPASLQNWAPVGGPGMPFPPAMGAGTSQFDPLHVPHQIPVPMFGRPDGPQGLGFPSSGPFVAGASLGAGPGTSVRPLFIPDGFIERPKKAAVPSWLREEIMKKKAAGLAGNATGTLLSDESSGVNGGEPAIPLNQRLGISDKLRSGSPGLSDEEEDDLEEEIEAARNAAINQEIKRLLTEVLLKVTGDLFDEIAQEVLDEDSDDILQVKVSPDQQGRTSSQTSASPPVVVPSLSGRVLVSSIKSHGTSDTDGDKESANFGVTAGDVLGLGNYASDDETLGSKDYEEPLKGGEAKTEQQDHMILDSAAEGNLKENAHSGEAVDGPVASIVPVVQKIQNTKEDRNNDTRIPLVKQEKDEGEKRRQHEIGKKRLREQDYIDAQNGKGHIPGDLDVANIQGRLSTPKEDQGRAHAAGPKENPSDRRQSMSEQVGKSLSTERSNTGSKGEKQLQDKRETKSDTTARLVSGKGTTTPAASRPSSASFEKLDNKEKREEKREEKYKDPSGKEKKREERTKVISDTSGKEKNREERIKDSKEDNAARGLDAGAKDSGRDKRKEKVKEKAKPREKEHDRDRKKHEKKGREGRSRRADAIEKKVRHRSSSSSSSGGAEGSSSSSSDKSRGRSRARRSSRPHNAMSSPGRSRKRRVSRSRSRSRSPHAKHTHRRNASSPSHEKSRRSGSKSPVHRRRRG